VTGFQFPDQIPISCFHFLVRAEITVNVKFRLSVRAWKSDQTDEYFHADDKLKQKMHNSYLLSYVFCLIIFLI